MGSWAQEILRNQGCVFDHIYHWIWPKLLRNNYHVTQLYGVHVHSYTFHSSVGLNVIRSLYRCPMSNFPKQFVMCRSCIKMLFFVPSGSDFIVIHLVIPLSSQSRTVRLKEAVITNYYSTCAVIVYCFVSLQLHALYQTIVIHRALRKKFDRGAKNRW